ncbi:MAG TPA: ATP-binding cassette domain-containing protein, partial [Synergistaceae bacterium]|nr:ATP-binding cassette domain-containing protein [Synergistaceae bacterium]
MASLLECRGISRAFGGIRAVDDLSIAVDRGEILGLIGPNGAGKTTVFNLISGFYAPSEGEILLEGSPLTGLRPDAIVRRGVARTFQNIRLFARQSALENVRTPLLQRHPRGIVPTLLGTPSVRREEKRCTARAMELL